MLLHIQKTGILIGFIFFIGLMLLLQTADADIKIGDCSGKNKPTKSKQSDGSWDSFEVDAWLCTLKVEISGDISNNDLQSLNNKITVALKKYSEVHISAEIDSRGGDIDAAMGIGRLFRKHEAAVMSINRQKNSCYSACVMLVAGAVQRSSLFADMLIYNYEGIGIHRPYFSNHQGINAKDTELRYKNMIERIRRYFQEMNISNAFADMMIEVPPNKIKLLSYDDAVRFLPLADPAYDEVLIARQATIYGVSVLEMRKRQQNGDNNCGLEQLIKKKLSIQEGFDCSAYYDGGLSPDQNWRFVILKNQCRKEAKSLEDSIQCMNRAYKAVLK